MKRPADFSFPRLFHAAASATASSMSGESLGVPTASRQITSLLPLPLVVKILERSDGQSLMMDSLAMADKKNWLQLLAYVTGSINQELLLRNEYLLAENHILKSQIKGRLPLSDGEKATFFAAHFAIARATRREAA